MTIRQGSEVTDKPVAEIVDKDGRIFVRDAQEGLLEVKYGLPPEVRYCRRCVTSNQRPSTSVEFRYAIDSKKSTSYFDDDGICDACRYAEQMDHVADWEARRAELTALCDKYRSRSGSYDCIVPGSGGSKSVHIARVLREEFGMQPLTVTWAPHLYTDVGWNNYQAWVHQGAFDNYLFTPDGDAHRKLTQLAFRNLLHPFQAFIFGQNNYAPKMALKMGIPLIFYAEGEAEYGAELTGRVGGKRDLAYFADLKGEGRTLYFGGVQLEELPSHGISPGQMDPYLPVDAARLESAGIEAHFVGYYLKDVLCDEAGREEISELDSGDGSIEDAYATQVSSDDTTDPFHYWTTLVKYGVGRATYDASRRIRSGQITREQGIALVHRHDDEFPEKIFPEFLDYLRMEEAEFHEIADSFRSPHLWHRSGGGWQLRHRVADGNGR